MSQHEFLDEFLSDLDDDSPQKSKKSKRKRSLTPDWLHRSRNLSISTNLNHFVTTKIQEYLQCEIQPWKYPTHSTDKVELEPISSNFLPTFSISAPILRPIVKENGEVEVVRRVCGSREIFMKRMHIKYLKEKEKEEICNLLNPTKDSSSFHDDEAIASQIRTRFLHLAPGGGRKEDSSKKKKKKKEEDKKRKTETRDRHEEDRKRKSDYSRKPRREESKEKNLRKHYKEKSSTKNVSPPRYYDLESKIRTNEKVKEWIKKHEKMQKERRKQYKRKPPPPENVDKIPQSRIEMAMEDVNSRKERKDKFKARIEKVVTYLKNHIKIDPEKKKSSATKRVTYKDEQLRITQPRINFKISEDAVSRTFSDVLNNNEIRQRKIHPEIIDYRKPTPSDILNNNQPLDSETSQSNSDKNANFLYQSSHKAILKSHTIINIQDEQTVERIAQQFRQTEVPLFAVTVNSKNPAPKNAPKVSVAPKKLKLGTRLSKRKSRMIRPGHFTSKKAASDKLVRALEIKKKMLTRTQTSTKNFLSFLNDEELDITNFDSYYRYVYGMPIHNPPDRDSEWLDLSITDEDEEDQKIQTFDKNVLKWMHQNISFESQTLVSDLDPFNWICLLTGRQFYYSFPDFIKGDMEFAISRAKMIPFFFSTFIMWAVLVINFSTFAQIEFNDVDSTDTKHLQLSSEDQAVLLEKLEIGKYSETILFIMANLSFVAVWSVMVILRDGQLIVHYLNCWSPALAEMETSATVGIKRITFYNMLVFLISAALIVTAFTLDFPGNVRGSCGVFAMLMFKVVIPEMRLIEERYYYYCEIFGLCFILYIFFCARLLFTLMQILALIIKNASEMWNFKFALAFDQLILTNRGQLKRLSLRVPYAKFFTHHRMLTALVKMYGETFGVPIMIYLLVQVGMMTYVLVNLFNFKAGNVRDYQGKHEVTYESYTSKNVKRVVKIPFYHSPVEEITTSVFVLSMVVFDFMFTTEVLSSASQSFLDGFEFVRRTNLILCKSTHQRRVIQSLLWSMSSTDPTLLTASNYFSITRATIFAGLGTAVFFFSLIIQLQTETKQFVINFKLCSEFDTETIEKTELRCKLYREGLGQ